MLSNIVCNYNYNILTLCLNYYYTSYRCLVNTLSSYYYKCLTYNLKYNLVVSKKEFKIVDKLERKLCSKLDLAKSLTNNLKA